MSLTGARLAKFFGIFALLATTTYSAAQSGYDRIEVKEITPSSVRYAHYEWKQESTAALSNIVLHRDARWYASDFTGYYKEVPDFKLLLLRKGLAKLRNRTGEDSKYLDAEEAAKKKHLNIWYVQPPPKKVVTQKTANAQARRSAKQPKLLPVQPRPQSPPSKWSAVSKRLASWRVALWAWILVAWRWVVSAGLLSTLFGLLYHYFHIQRRVRLVLIGCSAAGKTVLFRKILNPSLRPDQLLDEQLSRALDKAKLPAHIPYGDFKIYLRLLDVPGSKFALTFQQLLKGRFSTTKTIIVIVLAPTPQKADVANATDLLFLGVQLGYVQAFIEGALGAKHMIKPKAIVVFMNKFDLFADHAPDDSASAVARQQFEQKFAQHLASAQAAARRLGIPMCAIVGSAVQGWNTQEVVETVGGVIFNARR